MTILTTSAAATHRSGKGIKHGHRGSRWRPSRARTRTHPRTARFFTAEASQLLREVDGGKRAMEERKGVTAKGRDDLVLPDSHWTSLHIGHGNAGAIHMDTRCAKHEVVAYVCAARTRLAALSPKAANAARRCLRLGASASVRPQVCEGIK